jgi:hypothetical protein
MPSVALVVANVEPAATVDDEDVTADSAASGAATGNELIFFFLHFLSLLTTLAADPADSLLAEDSADDPAVNLLPGVFLSEALSMMRNRRVGLRSD